MNDRIVKKILKSPVYDIAKKTPLELAPQLTQRLSNTIYFKREDLQPVFSFKLRGAYAKIKALSSDTIQQGVIAASAGNHAQGVALSAQKLGIPATIVMPITTPPIKVASVEKYGGTALLHGITYDEAYQFAQNYSESKNIPLVHPYDDWDVIAGQGTIAKEILEQHPDPIDYIFVPVGGGGLLAGIITYIKAIKPSVKVIAVEPDNAACLRAALDHNRRVKLKQVGIFADGVAVAQIGQKPFKLIKPLIDDCITVETDEICSAIRDIYEENRSITEPAGALALAGLKKYTRHHQINGKTLITINCGANLNFDRLKHIAERTDLGAHKEAIFSVKIPEKKGSFKEFCNTLSKYTITEFNYRYSDSSEAIIFVGIGLKNADEREQVIQSLTKNGYDFCDFSYNELAKLHVRHMIGGKCPQVTDEKCFRFQFPEKPGALLNFLTLLGSKFNISLFHYRNHGAAFGRVLVGIQVPKSQSKSFDQFLKKIGYTYFDETDNLAFQQFF